MSQSPEETQFQLILENVLIEICRSKGVSRDDLMDIVADYDQRVAKGVVNDQSHVKMRTRTTRTLYNRYARRYLNRLGWSERW